LKANLHTRVCRCETSSNRNFERFGIIIIRIRTSSSKVSCRPNG